MVRKEGSAIQVSRSHLCMMFVLLPRLFRLCRFVRLVRQIEQVRVVAKLYRCRNDLTRASGPAGRLGRDRGSFQQSDETAGILKQLKDRMSADLTAFLEKGVGSDDQSPGSCEKPRRRRQPRWRRLLKPRKSRSAATTLERQESRQSKLLSNRRSSSTRGQRGTNRGNEGSMLWLAPLHGGARRNPRTGEEIPPLFTPSTTIPEASRTCCRRIETFI